MAQAGKLAGKIIKGQNYQLKKIKKNVYCKKNCR